MHDATLENPHQVHSKVKKKKSESQIIKKAFGSKQTKGPKTGQPKSAKVTYAC
jgi:hypothetical protein